LLKILIKEEESLKIKIDLKIKENNEINTKIE
jgi:hypothetical protein